ncbi:LuxR C-terminal-related transcriptional regulator [Eggerthella sinensis]|nr:LuxR C-terminal-related transcriptional regulator [Eggerthella sinensis]
MLARGYGSQSISDALTVSLYTTRAHTRNIYAKLDVHSRQELADRVRAYVEAREV